MTRRKTHEEFVKEIKDKYDGEYSVLGTYSKSNIKIKVRHNCEKCGNYEMMIIPNNLLRGYSCPVCANQKVVLGINTIWDTDRWMVDLGVSEEDAKRYTHSSGQKITVKCPDCGKEKKIRIADVYRRKSISCSCGNGKSYPEKFIYNLLWQLGVDFETEYKSKWAVNKRYDFYLKNSNCIIETHGEQHYKKGFRIANKKTLKQEQANDKYKREIALSNGIKHYIELDCRESNMDYIKNSILNSKLSQLFDLSNINWTSCAEFANKNIVKEVCDYWNNKREEETTTSVGEIFKLSKVSIRNYLNKGVELGWCEYEPKKEIKKCKKIIVYLPNGEIKLFNSCYEIEKKSKEIFHIRLLQESIRNACRSKKSYKGYQFKYIENVA